MPINVILSALLVTLRLAAYANSSGQKNTTGDYWWHRRLQNPRIGTPT